MKVLSVEAIGKKGTPVTLLCGDPLMVVGVHPTKENAITAFDEDKAEVYLLELDEVEVELGDIITINKDDEIVKVSQSTSAESPAEGCCTSRLTPNF